MKKMSVKKILDLEERDLELRKIDYERLEYLGWDIRKLLEMYQEGALSWELSFKGKKYVNIHKYIKLNCDMKEYENEEY